MHYIDYSQYTTWQACRWKWIEKEVRRRRLRYSGQRSDALALGSLVHSGVEAWHKEHKPLIAASAIQQIGPTPECLALAQQLVFGYVERYPVEEWQTIAVEKPLTFDIRLPNYMGVTKLDGYFKLDEQLAISDGIGSTIVLAPGWYSLEHKTRDIGVNRGLWMRKWEVNMQASFQCLGLADLVYSKFKEDLIPPLPVQGVLVNVFDKPRNYTPKRKCKVCGETAELVAWQATAIPKEFGCPLCGAVQELSEYKPKGPPKKPDYWRMLITRNTEQLIRDKLQITAVAVEMQQARALLTTETPFGCCIPNREECVLPWQRRECEFFRPHTYGFSTIGHPDYEDAEDYLGLGKYETFT